MRVLLALGVVLLCSGAMGWGSNTNDRVLLADVKAITLESGKMTTGRRSSPVPQLSCVGGSAGCYGSKQPRTVQCRNTGSDGRDAQWECKANLENAYQFGRIQVVCEGYEYPDDPYILKGSCGLEYEIDYTEQGRQGNDHHGGHHGGHHGTYGEKRSFGSFSGLIQLVVVVAIIYFLYSCMRGGQRQGVPQGGPASGYSDTSYGTGSSGTGTGGAGRPGFWTGAATGGALGYLFGNRGNTGYGYGGGYRGNSWGSGWGSGGGGGGWSSGGGGGGWSSGRRSGSSSSSSRTTSGFGGTGRR